MPEDADCFITAVRPVPPAQPEPPGYVLMVDLTGDEVTCSQYRCHRVLDSSMAVWSDMQGKLYCAACGPQKADVHRQYEWGLRCGICWKDCVDYKELGFWLCGHCFCQECNEGEAVRQNGGFLIYCPYCLESQFLHPVEANPSQAGRSWIEIDMEEPRNGRRDFTASPAPRPRLNNNDNAQAPGQQLQEQQPRPAEQPVEQLQDEELQEAIRAALEQDADEAVLAMFPE